MPLISGATLGLASGWSPCCPLAVPQAGTAETYKSCAPPTGHAYLQEGLSGPEKLLPVVWDTRAQSLGREDPLDDGTATHSSILAWRIPWTEEPGELQAMGSQRVGPD